MEEWIKKLFVERADIFLKLLDERLRKFGKPATHESTDKPQPSSKSRLRLDIKD